VRVLCSIIVCVMLAHSLLTIHSVQLSHGAGACNHTAVDVGACAWYAFLYENYNESALV
jgi:hypothetical protein